MNWFKQNWYRLAIIVIMLGAFGDNPYSYYQFLRWATVIASFYLAYAARNESRIGWTWTFAILGILFNPIVPFYLDRGTWQYFNLIAAITYAISIFKFKLHDARAHGNRGI